MILLLLMYSPDLRPSRQLAPINSALAGLFEEIVRISTGGSHREGSGMEEGIAWLEQAGWTELRLESGSRIAKADILEGFKIRRYAASQYDEICFADRETSDVSIDIALGKEAVVRAMGEGEFGHIPQAFRFPAVLAHLWAQRYSQEVEYSTLYGSLPSYAMDAKGEIFSLDNTFFLNQFDQGVKRELVESTAGWDLSDLDLEKVPRLSVVMIEQERLVPITGSDYSLLKQSVRHIHSGKFIRVR